MRNFKAWEEKKQKKQMISYSDSKESACNARDSKDASLVPGSGRQPLEEEMTAHSGILSWKIPRTEETGRIQSMGSQRVGQN